MDDTLWVGSFDRGLARLRGGRWEAIATHEAHGGDWINSLCWDGSILWVGSAAGLGRWDPTHSRVIPVTEVEGRVQSIHCRERELFVATAAAVWIGSAHRWKKIDIAGEALHMAGDTLWVGTRAGIAKVRWAHHLPALATKPE